jgi:methionyl-tRNA formyltransferase
MRLVFMGSPEFAVPCLEAIRVDHEVALVVTQPDRPSGRGRALAAPPVKIAAERAGLRVLQPASVRPPEVAAELAATGAALAVVVAYGRILPRAVLDAFPLGCVNVHASLLPAYRGAAPIQWAIIRGEAETGVTIMRLDEGMDTGPVLLTRALAIAEDDTAGSLSARLAPLGAEALVEGLERIAAGTAAWRPQDDARASRAPMLSRRDGIIDFAEPARAVRDRIRGVDPWPAAVAVLGADQVKLHGASLAAGTGPPGAILAVEPAGAIVACGVGAVRIAELQAPGRRRLPFAVFVRGRPLPPGSTFARATLEP